MGEELLKPYEETAGQNKWAKISVVMLSAPNQAAGLIEYLIKQDGRKSVDEVEEMINNFYDNCSRGMGPYDLGSFIAAYPISDNFLDVTIAQLESIRGIRKMKGFYRADG